jgi:hypothetical protein
LRQNIDEFCNYGYVVIVDVLKDNRFVFRVERPKRD